MLKPLAAAALLFATAVSPARAVLLIDTLDPPGGALSGVPGELVGWGFTLTVRAQTPEPSAAALLALGLGGVAAARRRARRLRPVPPQGGPEDGPGPAVLSKRLGRLPEPS